MKRNQTRTLRSELQEKAIAKYSDGQLEYVGDSEDGRDFYGLNDEFTSQLEANTLNFAFEDGKVATVEAAQPMTFKTVLTQSLEMILVQVISITFK